MTAKPVRCLAASSFLLFALVVRNFACAAELQVRKVDGAFPKPGSTAFATGSGIVVGTKIVLTNRHVVQDDAGKVYDGFRVYIGPDYKTSIDARVISVCDNYDLALLETVNELAFSGLAVLDALPPLATRVTAYGFPLGSRFGVGLTTTGGQISRHPVTTSNDDDEEQAAVKSAIWHDAILSSGSSGGPLFGQGSLLVGINFAYLSSETKHALAVPANVVAAYLRQNNVTSQVQFVNVLEHAGSNLNTHAGTVFIEALTDRTFGRELAKHSGSSLHGQLVSELRSRLPSLNGRDFSKVAAGELQFAFPAMSAISVKNGEIARIKGSMTIIQILEGGMLTKINGVKFFILLPGGGGGELRARIGDEVVARIPVDGLYFVGAATAYMTVAGSESYAIPLLPLSGLAQDQEIGELISAEKSRRTEMEEQERKRRAELEEQILKRQAELEEQEQKRLAELEEQEQRQLLEKKELERAKHRAEAEKRYLRRIRRRFTDATGKHQVDAAAVAVDRKAVQLIRMTDKRQISIPIEKLSAQDRSWLIENEAMIRVYGGRLERLYSSEPSEGRPQPTAVQ